MSEERIFSLVCEWAKARIAKPSTTTALIYAVTFITALRIVGKAALLLAIPVFVIALVKEGDAP